MILTEARPQSRYRGCLRYGRNAKPSLVTSDRYGLTLIQRRDANAIHDANRRSFARYREANFLIYVEDQAPINRQMRCNRRDHQNIEMRKDDGATRREVVRR